MLLGTIIGLFIGANVSFVVYAIILAVKEEDEIE